MGIIEERQSIRAYKGKEIAPVLLRQILEAGLRAPSPKNRQPWHFVVLFPGNVRDRLLQRIRQSVAEKAAQNPGRQDIAMALDSVQILSQAPILVLVCYRPETAQNHDDGVCWPMAATDLETVELMSVGAAAENMLLKAQELGLGGLWCADILYAYRTIMEELKLKYPVVSALCFGYPAQQPSISPRDSVADRCAFFNDSDES